MFSLRNLTNKRLLQVTTGSKRTFFSKLFGQDKNKSRYVSSGGTPEESSLHYIRFLSRYSPKNALKTIEEGWENGNLPFNELYLREYFRACGDLKVFDKVSCVP